MLALPCGVYLWCGGQIPGKVDVPHCRCDIFESSPAGFVDF